MKFNSVNRIFFQELRKEVDSYFQENKILKTGNTKLHAKAVLLLVFFMVILVLPYVIEMPPYMHYILYAFLGVTIAAIGFNVGHDAAHGSFSRNAKVNNMLALSFDFVAGVSSFLWRFKHNTTHHTYTNIEGMDDDIETGSIFRFSRNQKWYWWHRFQWLYALPLYSLLYFQWIFLKDFKKLRERKVGQTEIKGVTTKEIIIILLGKINHIIIFLVIPYFVFGFKEMISAYLAMSATCGVVITVVFQLAHVQNKSSFPVPDLLSGDIENDWAISQVETTADFAIKNLIVTAFTGGLNHQIEHHLFPKVSHVHYPAISRIVKKKCKQFGISYHEYQTMIGAFVDHMNYLWKMSLRPRFI